jgi:hypothetical protein
MHSVVSMLMKKKNIPIKIPIIETAMVAPTRSEASRAVAFDFPPEIHSESFLYGNKHRGKKKPAPGGEQTSYEAIRRIW